MKMLKLWIAATGFLGILSFAAVAQESGARREIPSMASVSAGQSLRLVPGQAFSFQLRFDPAPDGYGGGEIDYRYQRVYPAPSQRNIIRTDGQIEIWGKTELHDGQAIYTLSLPITDLMSPGTWKLVEVTLGRSIQRPVSIPENIIFEIPEIPPVVAHIQAPSSVRAGQRYVFKITLDEFPKGLTQNCVPSLSGSLHQAWSPGHANSNAFYVRLNNIELKPGQLVYEMSGLFDPDLPSGPWQGEVGITPHGLWGMPGMCRCPQLKGDVQFTFTVEPALGLVTPSSVAVIVNPSQIKLLQAEADRLKAKAQHLKQQLNSENTASNQALLRNSVEEAMKDLDKTEAAFKDLYKTESDYKNKDGEPSYSKAVGVFFDDIRLEYDEARKALSSDSGQLRKVGPRLERVSAAVGGSPPRLNPVSIKVLNSILHNANAYGLAASAGTMTRDLDVRSVPEGATVSYWQRTDPEPKTLDQVTDSTIKGLYRARYSIRFQKQGYEEQVITFDGGESTSASVIARLNRKGDAR